MKSKPRVLIGVSLSFGLMSLLGAVSWACTVQARILALSPTAGSVGTVVTVRGESIAREGDVAIRWNGVASQQVGAARADETGNFVASVTVPDVAPGIYSLVVVAEGTGVGRNAFEVLASPLAKGQSDASKETLGSTQPASTDLWAGFDRGVDRPGLHPQPGKEDSQPALKAGLAILAAGAVGLLSAGSLAAEKLRRNRAGFSSGGLGQD